MILDNGTKPLLDPLSDQRTERYTNRPTQPRAMYAQDPRQENASRRRRRDLSASVRTSYRIRGKGR